MRRGRLTTVLIALLGLGLLALAASRIERISQLRRELEIENVNPLQDTQIASELRLPTVALFTFRSLAINYLWIRADNLKQEGQYFDALHLARMICTLQPNLASVWDFQSWNMAYNISVALPNGPERWNWVKNGFELIRDQGLVHNPRNPELHRSLALIFQHKIGGITDDMHRYYKERLAFEMMKLFGAGPTTNEQLVTLAAAPDDWDLLRQKPSIAKLVTALKDAEPDFASDELMFAGLLDLEFRPRDFSPTLHQVIADFARTDTLAELLAFIRADKLRHQWKMDPNLMLDINSKYGPVDYEQESQHSSLDWRLPFTHAIYWAVRGMQFTGKSRSFAELNLNRAVYHSLQDLFHYGHLQVFTAVPPPQATERQAGQELVDTESDVQVRVFLSQDLRMLPIAYQATLDLIKYYEDVGQEVPGGVDSGSINLARAGVRDLYLAGHRKMAQKYYRELHRRQPNNPEYQGSLETFVKARIKQDIEEITPRDASDLILSILRDSYARYAIGDDENAAINESHVRQIYQAYNAEFVETGNRVRLLDFSKMLWLAMQQLFDAPTVDPNIKGLLLRRLQIDKPQMYERVVAELRKKQEASK